MTLGKGDTTTTTEKYNSLCGCVALICLRAQKYSNKSNRQMKKSEIFQNVLTIVSVQADTSKEQILSVSRNSEYVDARCIAIYYWKHYGLETTYIMRRLNRKHHNSIHYLYNQYSDRLKNNRPFRHLSTLYKQVMQTSSPNYRQGAATSATQSRSKAMRTVSPHCSKPTLSPQRLPSRPR